MLEILAPGMIEEMEDEEGRELIERFRDYIKKAGSVREIVQNEKVMDIILQIRFLAFMDMEKQNKNIDLEKGARELYEIMKRRPEFIDLLSYFENYIFPTAQAFSNILKSSETPDSREQETQMGVEEIIRYFGGVENITYRRYMEFLYGTSFLKLICIFRPEFCETLNEIVATSLITDTLIFMFVLWINGEEYINEDMFLDAKETFKFVVQKYFIATERFFKMVSEPEEREIKLNWGWEGAIKDKRSSVEVQHEIFKWRLEN